MTVVSILYLSLGKRENICVIYCERAELMLRLKCFIRDFDYDYENRVCWVTLSLELHLPLASSARGAGQHRICFYVVYCGFAKDWAFTELIVHKSAEITPIYCCLMNVL